MTSDTTLLDAPSSPITPASPVPSARLAAIDVGTNSIHMIVVESSGLGYRVIDKEKAMVQLGLASLGGHPLTESAIERGIAALQTMAQIACQRGASIVVAVATSALREAPNRSDFIERSRRITGIDIRVISGEEEADYIYRAVRAAINLQAGAALIIDIGGGSTELLVATSDRVFLTASEPLGCLRLAQMFDLDELPSKGAVRACRQFVSSKLEPHLRRIRATGFRFGIGTSGTITTLTRMASGNGEARGSEEARWLRRSDLTRLVKQLKGMNAAQRAAEFSIDLKRAQTILGGAIVLDEVMNELGLERIRSCEATVREGIVERLLEDARSHSAGGDTVRRASVLQLAERTGCDIPHALHVARLALDIFDSTNTLHRLDPANRELLEYGALLHEAGVMVAFSGHHRHAYYIIRHAALQGFTDDELELVANVARYYRKATPADEHPNFGSLRPDQKRVIERLSAILRIAEALDRGHRQVVKGVAVKMSKERVHIGVVAANPELEVEFSAANKRARYFGELFDKRVEIEGAGALK